MYIGKTSSTQEVRLKENRKAFKTRHLNSKIVVAKTVMADDAPDIANSRIIRLNCNSHESRIFLNSVYTNLAKNPINKEGQMLSE